MSIEWVDVQVPPSFGPPGHQSSPVPDLIRVSQMPVLPPALPRRVVQSPASRDPKLRTWTTWTVESMTMLRNQLYQGFPIVVRNADGSLGLFTDNDPANPYGPGLWGWPIAGTPPLETMYQRTKRRPAWPGKRRQSTMSGACTAVPLPRAVSPQATLPGTYWALLFADGWLVHLFPDGETRTICGPQSWTDRYPLSWLNGDTDKFVVGQFDTLWGMTNDLCLHPSDPSKFIVTDALNRRLAVAQHFAPGPGNVRVSTWITAGPFPYALDAGPGEVYAGDRDSGEVRIYNVENASDSKVVAILPGGVASLKRTSKGTLTVMEQRGAQRLLEVTLSGDIREIWRAPTWVNPGYYKQHDTDAHGTCGPLDDSIVGAWASDGATAWRISLDGTFKSYLKENGASSWGSAGRQGPIETVEDPGVHYGPSWVRFSREFAEVLTTGGVGGGPVLWRPRQPGDFDGHWTVAQASDYQAGRSVWRSGGIPGGPVRPSFWHLAGHDGAHYTGPSPRDGGIPSSPERLVDLGDDGLLAWLRAGGRGETARPEFTLLHARQIRQFLRFSDDRAIMDTYAVPSGGSIPPPDPPPPPPPVDKPDVVLSLPATTTYRVIGGKPV